MVLGSEFFTEVEDAYESCYRHNPNPSSTFLLRMKVIEERARRLGSDIEEILAESLAGRAPRHISPEEEEFLEDYIKRNSIVKAFAPWIFVAYYFTEPGPEARLKVKVE